jgi:transposase InsO family protein
VTEHPTAAWTAQQIVEAFPEDHVPKYLMRDRDGVYGHAFRDRLAGMGIEELLSAPRSPWQNPFVERLIGSIRRECLDHLIVLGERHLLRILTTAALVGWVRTKPPAVSRCGASLRPSGRAAAPGRAHRKNRDCRIASDDQVLAHDLVHELGDIPRCSHTRERRWQRAQNGAFRAAIPWSGCYLRLEHLRTP